MEWTECTNMHQTSSFEFSVDALEPQANRCAMSVHIYFLLLYFSLFLSIFLFRFFLFLLSAFCWASFVFRWCCILMHRFLVLLLLLCFWLSLHLKLEFGSYFAGYFFNFNWTAVNSKCVCLFLLCSDWCWSFTFFKMLFSFYGFERFFTLPVFFPSVANVLRTIWIECACISLALHLFVVQIGSDALIHLNPVCYTCKRPISVSKHHVAIG